MNNIHILIYVVGLLLLLRRRAFQRNPFSIEKRVYLILGGLLLILWLGNAFHPSPLLFYEGTGANWRTQSVNLSWHIYNADYQSQPKLTYEGNTSLAINFHMQEGWLSFFHY